MCKAVVVVPTYNEIENIERLLRTVFSLQREFHVLVVDDNSPDGTARAVEANFKTYPNRLFILNRKEKDGLGSAYIAGFKWALEKEYDYIFEMDADFSHNPNDLIRLFNACHKDGNDMAIGSRYVKGVNVVNWPMSRVLMSWLASKYVRLIMRLDIYDTTAGFICYKRNVLERINLNNIRFVGYAFQIEMKFKTHLSNFKIKEVPVIFTDRTKGESKMSSGIISEAIFGVIAMKFNSVFNRKNFNRTSFH
ncbi:polyprenol monophosphomannose synthase [Aequorivita sp. SDUM287046]|uniref:Polyprenol monophosphomannose synthase n=1 Tax=Aequorivita aurantiaca TaxID=3053356 RepID=A0ABT8DEA7_9FLAO|nr:polyprenol monophosphomannose synthase [Aequorivita aurantiaca]MDN3722804.1 polyprenol monophosphomannose synthase [Aequorivita aurantiaca]